MYESQHQALESLSLQACNMHCYVHM